MSQYILNTLTTHSVFVSIGWTLVHFLWQATAIALLVAFGLAALRNRSAQSRYLLCCLGLSAMLVSTTLTFSWYLANPTHYSYELAGDGSANGDHVETNGTSLSAVNTEEPIASRTELLPPDQESAKGSPVPMPTTSQWTSFSAWTSKWFLACLPWLLLAWMTGVSILSLRMLSGLLRIRCWRLAGQPADSALNSLVQRIAERLHLNVPVQLLICSKVMVPAVVGWLRPAILLPGSMISGLTPRELESILAHELAHIRRHDYIINLVQSMVEILMFYHPAVWWLSSRIRAERENCCDDIAIKICGNRLALARALARMEELRCGQEAWVVAANGASLLARIRRIMGAPPTATENWWPAGAIVFGSIALLIGSLFLSTVQAEPDVNEWAADTNVPVNDDSQDNPWYADDETYETKKEERVRRDSKTGLDARVFDGIQLATLQDTQWRHASVGMKYSNVFRYSLIPAKIARELQARDLGEIDFGTEPPLEFNALQPQIAELIGVKRPAETEAAKVKGIHVHELTEPVEPGQKVVPYEDERVFLPQHLAFYGMNQKQQQKFRVVRIEKVALGVGPSFGPVNALVLDDENSDFGLLGTDWTQQVRGKNGEILWFAAPESAFFLKDAEQAEQEAQKQAADESAGWGELAEHSGLRSRLTLTTEQPQVGQPVLLKLELKNFGEKPTQYDPQDYAPFRVVRAVTADGKLAPFIGPRPQTFGQSIKLQPDESKLVWENVDAASLYLLQAGEYKFFAEGGEWAMQNLWRDSNTVTVPIREGTLSPKHQLIANVIEILPENWEISADTGGIYLRYSESNLKKDVRSVRVEWSKDKFPADKQIGWPIPGRDREFKNVTIDYLGELSFGHVYVLSLPTSTESVWPDYRKTLEQQVTRIRSQEKDGE